MPKKALHLSMYTLHHFSIACEETLNLNMFE